METKFLWVFLDFVLCMCNLISGKVNLKEKEYDTAALCYFVAGVCFLGAFNAFVEGIAMMVAAK